MPDLGLFAPAEQQYADGIEAHLVETAVRPAVRAGGLVQEREVLLGGAAEPGPFAGRDGLKRVPEARSPPELDLDEDERSSPRRAVADDEVDLAVRRALVAFDLIVPLPHEVPHREVLAALPDLTPVQPRPPSSPAPPPATPA